MKDRLQDKNNHHDEQTSKQSIFRLIWESQQAEWKSVQQLSRFSVKVERQRWLVQEKTFQKPATNHAVDRTSQHFKSQRTSVYCSKEYHYKIQVDHNQKPPPIRKSVKHIGDEETLVISGSHPGCVMVFSLLLFVAILFQMNRTAWISIFIMEVWMFPQVLALSYGENMPRIWRWSMSTYFFTINQVNQAVLRKMLCSPRIPRSST